MKIITWCGRFAFLLGLWFLLFNFLSQLRHPISVWTRMIHIGGAFLYLVCGLGLLYLKPWARYLFIILMFTLTINAGKNIYIYIYRLLQPSGVIFWPFEILGALILFASFVVPSLAIGFFLTKKIKLHFK